MIKTQKNGQLEYLTAEGIAAPHCFTTRLGGVSQGHLQSLNIGTSRGDTPENVLENYRRLGSSLGFDIHNLVLSRQTHSDIVHVVTEKDRGAGLFAPPLPDCDGLVTNTPGIALVVFTADCTPILFWDSETHAVGAAHAGWRGTASGIAARVVEAMGREYGSKPENIRAAFGPEAEKWITSNGEKYFLDLKAINRLVLNRAGVETVEMSDACTVCQCDRFWSHRVTKGLRGSQGAIIVCRED